MLDERASGPTALSREVFPWLNLDRSKFGVEKSGHGGAAFCIDLNLGLHQAVGRVDKQPPQNDNRVIKRRLVVPVGGFQFAGHSIDDNAVAGLAGNGAKVTD